MIHRSLYDRADYIADAVCRILTTAAAIVILGFIVRAALNFDSWKWMVQ
jgi:hypothetical protein